MPKLIKRSVANVRNLDLDTYKIWVGIVSRCHNRADPYYKDFGGKGIKVTRRWRNSFDNFLADMGPRPATYWLILIRKDRNYSKANCEWIAPADLNRKRARLKRLKYQRVAQEREAARSQPTSGLR